MASNDRIDDKAANAKLPKPEVKIIVDGQTVYKPGMKTYFVGDDGPQGELGIRGSEGNVVGGTVCSCNAVCTCEAVCSCESYSASCSCESYYSGGGGCSCNQVCTCVPVH